MTARLLAVSTALLLFAIPAAAQDSSDRVVGVESAVTTAATGRLSNPFRTVTFHAEPHRIERSRFTIHAAWSAGREAVTRVPQRRSKAPVVGGAVLGAVTGFFAGDYVQRSVCEFDCGPGGFTWGFTAAGALGGAAIGLLLR